MDCSVPAIRCRQIGEADIAAVAALLGARLSEPHAAVLVATRWRGWRGAQPPPGLPKYGYLLESDGVPVGAHPVDLLDHARGRRRLATRCNLSSWYVEPAFRAYATLLVSQALRHKDVTYINVSAAPHTWPIIEAQGFSRYCDGVFVAVPMLNDLFGGAGVRVFDAGEHPDGGASMPFEQDILLQHAEHGCISLWCETPERAYPFVFPAAASSSARSRARN